MLVLRAEQGPPQYARLVSINARRVVLAAGPLNYSLPVEMLAILWRGEFTTLWRAPDGYSQLLEPGARGVAVDVLARRLASLRNEPLPPSGQVLAGAVVTDWKLSAEALAENVIDCVAADVPDLLRKIEGIPVYMPSGRKETLSVKGAEVKEISSGLTEKLLRIFGEPNVAYILMIIGVWGIILEFSHPGFGVPGIVGTISLILAFFAFQTFTQSIAGLLLHCSAERSAVVWATYFDVNGRVVERLDEGAAIPSFVDAPAGSLQRSLLNGHCGHSRP